MRLQIVVWTNITYCQGRLYYFVYLKVNHMSRKLVCCDVAEMHIDFDNTLDGIISSFQELKDVTTAEEVVSQFVTPLWEEDQCSEQRIRVSAYRYETNQEYADRLGVTIEELPLISYHPDDEYRLYQRLKEKYEK